MPPLTNAEKQARFRKKEELQKFADRCFREAQLGAFQHGAKGPALLAQIKSLAELPSGWTDEDLERAVERIQQLWGDLVNPDHELSNDVHEGRGSMEEFARTPDPAKHMKDTQEAIENTQALAAHLISAVELTDLSNSERAAALMEAMRHVARSLANDRPLRKSNANTVCLATLPPHYQRPDWFPEALTRWLAFRLGDENAKADLGKRLLNFRFGV